MTASAGLTVVVGNVPYGPTLKVRFPFDDAGPGTTTPSDVSSGGVNVTLQMISQSGSSTNLHGAANSGVAGLTNPNRALNLSSNPNQGASGVSGNFAAATNSAFGFGNVTNFVVTMWMKQLYFLPTTIGPRMFILGNSTNSDCGTPNSIGMKFQDAADLYFFVNTIQATAAFGSNLPTNSWIFLAMSYDGNNVSLYEGADTAPAMLISTTAAAGQTVPLGSAASLFLGNRPDRARCFAGWIDDFRFYTGAGDLSFVESVRQSASGPSGLTTVPGNNQVSLSWNPLLGATSYNIKRSAVSGGPYTVISPVGTVAGTNYIDSTATNGATYYYVVSAWRLPSTTWQRQKRQIPSIRSRRDTPSAATGADGKLQQPAVCGHDFIPNRFECFGSNLQLDGAINGFTATNQNPSIVNASTNASGIYSVTATVAGLTSTPGTVAVTVNPPLVFSIQTASGNLILKWPYGTLQSATNLFGPWMNVTNATSPFTNMPSVPQQFYRVLVQ